MSDINHTHRGTLIETVALIQNHQIMYQAMLLGVILPYVENSRSEAMEHGFRFIDKIIRNDHAVSGKVE